MRTLCGLITVMVLLGPIGMGLISNVDAPFSENGTSIEEDCKDYPEEHGTRSPPNEGPTNINLYFHRNGNSMNTSDIVYIPRTFSGDITFTLQDTLVKNFLVESPSPGFPMWAEVYLEGTGSLAISVYDNDDTTLVGSTTHGSPIPFDYDAPTLVNIPISFEAEWGQNYTFSIGHVVVIDFDFTGLAFIHYDSLGFSSRLRLYCSPITDIGVDTYRFNNDPSKLFYPNDIDFPEGEDRRQVRIKGKVSDVFNKWDKKYIQEVQVRITGPDNFDMTNNASWDRQNSEYSYTWNYLQPPRNGEYKVTVNVFDEQDNNFTASNTFNMSRYGVVLTSPSQDPKEGKYGAWAKINVVQDNITSYEIDVWSIGYEDTGVNISTGSTQTGWVWWLEGDDLIEEHKQNGDIINIEAGTSKTIYLVVNAEGQLLDSWVTIIITAASFKEPTEADILNTKTTVVVEYDVDMEFASGQRTETKSIEMGDSASFEFNVENSGGTNDKIWFEIAILPAGWSYDFVGTEYSPELGDYVELAPAQSKDVTLTITTTSGGDITVNVPITGKSYGSYKRPDPVVVSDTITATIIMTSGVKLELIDLTPEKDADPDEQIYFNFQLTNTGTKSHNFTVTLTQPSSNFGWEDGDVSLDKNFDQNQLDYDSLGAGSSRTFQLYITPTIVVYADNYTITVRAARKDDPENRYDRQSVYCWVNEVYEIEVIEPPDLELEAEAEPGDKVEYTIEIKNNGNMQERVNIIIVNLPGGWKADFGNASNRWFKDIEPGDTEEIKLTLSIPDDAEGDETVDVTVSIEPAVSDSIEILTHTKIKATWFGPLLMLLVPLLLFVVIIVMVVVIYRRR